MTRMEQIHALVLAAALAAAPVLADGHKPACDRLDDATDQTNSKCED